MANKQIQISKNKNKDNRILIMRIVMSFKKQNTIIMKIKDMCIINKLNWIVKKIILTIFMKKIGSFIIQNKNQLLLPNLNLMNIVRVIAVLLKQRQQQLRHQLKSPNLHLKNLSQVLLPKPLIITLILMATLLNQIKTILKIY